MSFFNKKGRKNRKIIWVLGLILLNGGLAIIAVHTGLPERTMSPRTYRVVLTEKGFEPHELSILQGDVVIFATDRDKSFWPASDLHPTHTLYPEFDPKRPIGGNETWRFLFRKKGTWSYHDHLAPLYQGLIRVGARVAVSAVPDNCGDGDQDVQCWRAYMTDVAQKEGLGSGFESFERLFEQKPVFAEHCHEMTHLLGQVAYEEFQRNGNFPVTPQIQYCSYGFFHGFIEAMLQKSGDLSGVGTFCDYLDEQLKNKASFTACLHGIGHGVTDGQIFPESERNNPQAIIDPGLRLCKKVGKNDYEVQVCASGVFNQLADMYDAKGGPRLPYDPNDIYAICRQQQEPFKDACYGDMKGLVMRTVNNDFSKAARFIEVIDDDDDAKTAMDNMASFVIYYALQDEKVFQDALATCQHTQQRLRTACVSGLGAGFVTAGSPNKEYERALSFCAESRLSDAERDGCYHRVVPLIVARYGSQVATQICASVPSQYKDYCR